MSYLIVMSVAGLGITVFAISDYHKFVTKSILHNSEERPSPPKGAEKIEGEREIDLVSGCSLTPCRSLLRSVERG